MSGPRVVVLDNVDSFVHNLARYVAELGGEAIVLRADRVSVADVAALAPDRLLVSPGPCTPAQAGISVATIRALGPSIPTLGVCLGHQAIAVAYGADVVRSRHPRHGKTSPVEHDGGGVFAGVPSPVTVGRYHSLVVEEGSLPPELVVTARSNDGDVMGIRHRVHPVEGVQFHPESALTEYGYWMLERFLFPDRASGDSRPPVRADAWGDEWSDWSEAGG